MSSEEEQKDPMVIHDAIEKKVYTPEMDGGFDPEQVCMKISSAIEKIHQGGLRKEDFFPTFLVSEMAHDSNHKWAEEEGQFGFIYGYVFGHMLANFEKNKDTKLEFVSRDMTDHEVEEYASDSITELNQEELDKMIEKFEAEEGTSIDDLIGGDDDSDFDPPEPWNPESMEGYDPTK